MSFQQALIITAIDLFPIRAKSVVSPNMALGQMPTRPALLIRIKDSEGCFGWGEVWANFPPRANTHKAQLIEDVVSPKLMGFSFTDPIEVDAFLRGALSTYFLHVGQKKVFEHILAGIDIALWDLALRSAGKTFWQHMGLAGSEVGGTNVPTYASSINLPDLERLMPLHAELGQSHFKLKIGFQDEADVAFVRKAASVKPVGTHLMLDNNQTWTLARAKTMLSALEEYDLLFSEEPIPADSAFEDWEQLAKFTSIPLAGGENIYGIDEFLRMTDAGMRYLQPDVAKWGGITGALELAKRLPDGVKLWPHFMGTAVGQVAALAVAAASGVDSVCEMDVNTNALRTELCGDALAIRDGLVGLPNDAGLLVPPLPEKLNEFSE